MQVIAGSRCLLQPSRYETFSRVTEEALAHGVPVSCLEAPPALSAYPSLSREWGDVTTTSLEERQAAQDHLRATYTMEAYGERLEALLPMRTT